jgi:DNA-binding response OmpR family regulator
MVSEDGARATALVISDDDELGGLLALNLRHRLVSVEQTDFRLAASSRWLPANGRPDVVVINVERSSTDPVAFLQKTRERAWLIDVPIVLAADNATAIIARLGRAGTMIATKLGDVGTIVAATLAFLPTPSRRA